MGEGKDGGVRTSLCHCRVVTIANISLFAGRTSAFGKWALSGKRLLAPDAWQRTNLLDPHEAQKKCARVSLSKKPQCNVGFRFLPPRCGLRLSFYFIPGALSTATPSTKHSDTSDTISTRGEYVKSCIHRSQPLEMGIALGNSYSVPASSSSLLGPPAARAPLWRGTHALGAAALPLASPSARSRRQRKLHGIPMVREIQCHAALAAAASH